MHRLRLRWGTNNIRQDSRLTDTHGHRGGPLAFVSPPKHPFLEILRDSGIESVELRRLDSRTPATSYKQRGRSTFQIELLAPARGEEIGSSAIPELHAQATTLPFLGYLLKESQLTAVLAQDGSCAVRVPIPERFAVRRLIKSRPPSGGTPDGRGRRRTHSFYCGAFTVGMYTGVEGGGEVPSFCAESTTANSAAAAMSFRCFQYSIRANCCAGW